MGLGLIDIADGGLLIEAVIRKCDFRQWDLTASHHNYIHGSRDLDISTIQPLAIGLLGFHYSADSIIQNTIPELSDYIGLVDNYLSTAVYKDDDTVTQSKDYASALLLKDLGMLSFDLFEKLFYLVELGHIKTYSIIIPIIHSKDAQISDYDNNLLTELTKYNIANIIGKYTCLGYLPWKLLDIVTTKISKDGEFLSRLYPYINQCIECVRKCETVSAESDKRSLCKQYSVNIRKNI
jgi:hypothetical protein